MNTAERPVLRCAGSGADALHHSYPLHRLLRVLRLHCGRDRHPLGLRGVTMADTSTTAMRFRIGEDVWVSLWEAIEDRVVCPDCGGTGRLRVILHDEQEVSIECDTCRRGYEPPRGTLTVYTRKPMAIPTAIVGVEIADGKIVWRTSASYHVEDDRVFANEASALNRAKEIAAEADRAERDRIASKEKPTHSWAWNASYHRREIKEAQRRIEYHTRKLNVASLKAREDRAGQPSSSGGET